MQAAFFIRKIAVLGAGVMGAQIAAHCVNAGFETLLFDLTAEDGESNAVVHKAISNLTKLKPAPLGTPQTAALIHACNYDHNLTDLAQCDLIIEAIAERLDLKIDLYQRITPYLHKHSILVSNTSGLGINTLADALPEEIRPNFCGVHFFNPPRYMHLVELIPSATTSKDLLDNLETWITSYLGKGVVRAKDTPNFIANRVGVFSLLATMHHAQTFQLGLDEVDALTGSLLGRPKSATFRTMDVVGLDTMNHVVHTMNAQLPNDPWSSLFTLPDWLLSMINRGELGQKAGQGIYRKNGKTIEVYDVDLGDYRPAKGEVHEEVKSILKLTNPKEQLQRLFSSEHVQAKFLAACFRDLFHYCAYHLQEIAHSVRDVDLAICWGFGWAQGPFATWQSWGVPAVRAILQQEITADHALSDAALPAWLLNLEEFYTQHGAYSPTQQQYSPTSDLPVYKKQLFPENGMHEISTKEVCIFANEGIELCYLKDDVGIISFKTKANSIGQTVLDGLNEALNLAEKRFKGVVFYQHDAGNFSSGADLRAVSQLIRNKEYTALDKMIHEFQNLLMRIKYSPIPVVAALRGSALGGGCELMLHCPAIVAAFESYPGLVEAGVGLIPAGGGSKEMALRAALKAGSADIMLFLQPYFEQIATAVVAGSAPDALQRGYLRANDSWVMHTNEVVYAALAKIKNMIAANYVPSLPQTFAVAGREGRARLQAGLINWREGGFISEHDYFLASQIAYVLCGGEVNSGVLVDEAWILKLEREAFITLAETSLTQARIAHLLETGKPLRN
jgi:3-hydroxyacyl-CoA dehydrogenase